MWHLNVRGLEDYPFESFKKKLAAFGHSYIWHKSNVSVKYRYHVLYFIEIENENEPWAKQQI